MGAYNDFLTGIKATLQGITPIGGTMVPVSENFAGALAAQVKGGTFPVPDLETLIDIPNELLMLNQEIIVAEHERPDGSIMPKTRLCLKKIPADGKRVNEIVDFDIYEYWAVVETGNLNDTGGIEVQYAPNYDGKRPFFLATQISSDAYQAGYPTTALYIGANPADIIWVDEFDPTLNHAWMRQRIGTQPWGIPIPIASGVDYEQNQYIDVIFRWVPKATAAPARPIQPINYLDLPTGWANTPGADYATRILTEDLYRSQALKNPYGVIKSQWDLPVLISSDPDLVRYGNEPGSTDFLNDLHWRGYFTPGLDTFMATRTSGASTDWTITKLDQESGEFPDFVFRAFPLGADEPTLSAGRPTSSIPIGGDAPNDWLDAAPAAGDNEIVYVSKSVKFSDGSLKTPWSFPRRFDGMDTIQALIEESPGDVFFQSRNALGNLAYAFSNIVMTARLYRGVTAITAGITQYKWYRGATLIVFDSGTHKATNLGAGLNNYHTASPDRSTLTINPESVDVAQQYKLGIVHTSRPTEYPANIEIRDAADDGNAYVADILPVNGTTFKNQTGLYRFDSTFFKGGIPDLTNVVFDWSIIDSSGAPLANALRNAGGASVGTTNYVAATIYVQGSDIDQYATLILRATFGQVVRTTRVTLTDVQDAEAIETLYWGSGSTFPGSPTDFLPRTLTKTEVLALAIGYDADAAGKWFMIQRVNGVWGGEIQLRSESARPNGGISLQIWKNIEAGVDPVPTAPAVPGAGSIVPAGWTVTPTAFTGGQDTTYITSCFFILRTDVNADPTTLTRDNYTPVGTYGTPKRITGVDGDNATPSDPGDNGWSPYIGVVADGARRVLFLVDWIGGEGTKPAGSGGIASYIGPLGLTTIANATDIRGSVGPSGSAPRSTLIASTTHSAGYVDAANVVYAGASWVNNTGANVLVKVKVSARARNTGNGGASLALYVGVNAIEQQQTVSNCYFGNVDNYHAVDHVVDVPNGATLTWRAVHTAIVASPNLLSSSGGFLVHTMV